jgi:IS30 family transposase
MKVEQGRTMISHEAIYQYIYSPAGKEQKLTHYLRKKRQYRYPRARRKRQKEATGKVPIAIRPPRMNDRSEFGHGEGDLVLFKKSQANLFTLRERRTRLLIAIKNANRQSQATAKTLLQYMASKAVPVLSWTLDKDPAFAKHKQISPALKSDVYFCEAYKSYQKGAIENGNRRIREKLPRKTNIEMVEQEEIDTFIEALNNRPMKILGFRTPKEAFLQERLQRSAL